MIPSTILPEISYLINKYLSVEVELKMLADIKEGNLALKILKPVDLTRTIEVIATYRDARIGFVDASLVAMAERLKVGKILTTDVAHFAMFRPQGMGTFEIVPQEVL
ncbi:MAG: Ribonuclease VapC26 [Actinobacteria bacterium]|nr:Ribonuclease VapC26 [Actinomycetota bacterium]